MARPVFALLDAEDGTRVTDWHEGDDDGAVTFTITPDSPACVVIGMAPAADAPIIATTGMRDVEPGQTVSTGWELVSW